MNRIEPEPIRILSFDVGIRNLAFSIMHYDSFLLPTIVDWQTIDVLMPSASTSTYTTEYLEYIDLICSLDIIGSSDTSSSKPELLDLCAKWIPQFDTNVKQTKKELHSKLKSFLTTRQKQNINHKHVSFIEAITSKTLLSLQHHFPPSVVMTLDYIAIENQPAKLNSTMKSIQNVIYNYFIHHKVQIGATNNRPYISLIGACNKINIVPKYMKQCNDLTVTQLVSDIHTLTTELTTCNTTFKANKPTLTAKECEIAKRQIYCLTKQLGIMHVDFLLSTCIDPDAKWKQLFDNTKKKDDLADTLLQNMHVMGQHALRYLVPLKKK